MLSTLACLIEWMAEHPPDDIMFSTCHLLLDTMERNSIVADEKPTLPPSLLQQQMIKVINDYQQQLNLVIQQGPTPVGLERLQAFKSLSESLYTFFEPAELTAFHPADIALQIGIYNGLYYSEKSTLVQFHSYLSRVVRISVLKKDMISFWIEVAKQSSKLNDYAAVVCILIGLANDYFDPNLLPPKICTGIPWSGVNPHFDIEQWEPMKHQSRLLRLSHVLLNQPWMTRDQLLKKRRTSDPPPYVSRASIVTRNSSTYRSSIRNSLRKFSI